MTEINRDEWMAELERLQAQAGAGEGFTSRELADAWGCNNKTVLVRLNTLKKHGRLEFFRKTISRLDGFTTVVSSYRLKPKEGE